MNDIYSQVKINVYSTSEKVTVSLNKQSPYIEYFKAHPTVARGAAILVCPEGSYSKLADQREGVDVARFYNQYGVGTFVLRYRINSWDQSGHRHPNQYQM